MSRLSPWKGIALSILLTACDNGSNRAVDEPALVELTPEDPVLEEPNWGYSGDVGPENWASLDESYASCSQGLEQSPIDVDVSTPPSRVPAITPSYSATPLVIFNNGRTVEVEVHEGDSLAVGENAGMLCSFTSMQAASIHSMVPPMTLKCMLSMQTKPVTLLSWAL